MAYNEINKESINKLMDIFYNKVRADKNLGPIFNEKIGTSNDEWDKHKDKISNFWQCQLLREGHYSGQPMKAHMELPPFPREFFSVWLNLFSTSLDEVFTEDSCKEIFLHRANVIASSFQNVLYRG